MGSVFPDIPDHELLRLIGRGSYGEVWMARNAFGTLRAVKVVRCSTFESDRPFSRELSGIQRYEPISRAHEGLVDILQVGRNETDRFFYYVMELADDAATGLPVASDPASIRLYQPRMLTAGSSSTEPLGPRRAIPLFLILAEGLGHLHAHGLLHRDIKSANVIFVNGVPKLADLGLVVEAGESRTFVGTEGFIPPEGPGTKSADLYAFGKLMYEVVTGRDRMDFPALPLDRLDPAFNHDLLELNAVLLRCCAAKVHERYQSAAELIADLAILRSGQSVHDLRSFQHRLKWARRVGAGALLTACLLLAAILIVQRKARVDRENFNRSEALRLRSERAELRANGELFVSLIAQASAERRTGRTGAREKSLAALSQAAALYGATPALHNVGISGLRSEAISALALPDMTVVKRIPGKSGNSVSIALSPDGRWLAQAVDGEAVEIRDRKTGATLHRLSEADSHIAAFSPDSRFLVTQSDDESQKLWDVSSGTVWVLLPPHQDRFFGFGPGSNNFTVQHERRLSIRTIASGAEALSVTLPVVPDVHSLAPRSGHVAWSGRGEPEVNITDLSRAKKSGRCSLPPQVYAMSLAWSSDESTLAIGTSHHRVLLWHPDSTNAPVELIGHGAEVVSLSWSPDGRLLLTGSWDNTTRLWSLDDRREISRYWIPAWHNSFLDSGREITLFAAANHEMLVCDLHYEEVCRQLREPGDDLEKSPYKVIFSPGGDIIFEGCHDGIRAFRTDDGQLVGHRAQTAVKGMYPIKSECNRFIALTSSERAVVNWWTNGLGEVDFAPFEASERWELAAIHPMALPWVGQYQSRLALYYSDGMIKEIPGSTNAAATALSSDGRWVAASVPPRAAYWEVGAREGTCPMHDLGVARSYGIGISRDGKRIYHATLNALCCTEAATGRRFWSTQLSENANFNAVITESFDGKWVAVGIPPDSVFLVNARDGSFLARVEHPDPQPINDIAFSPDGNWFAVACASHVTQLWNLRRLRADLSAMNADW